MNIPPPKNHVFHRLIFRCHSPSPSPYSLTPSRSSPCSSTLKCKDYHFYIKVRLIFSLIRLRHSFQLQHITLHPLIPLIRPVVPNNISRKTNQTTDGVSVAQLSGDSLPSLSNRDFKMLGRRLKTRYKF